MANLAFGQATGLSTMNIAVLSGDRRSLDDKYTSISQRSMPGPFVRFQLCTVWSRLESHFLGLVWKNLRGFRVPESINAALPHVNYTSRATMVNATGTTAVRDKSSVSSRRYLLLYRTRCTIVRWKWEKSPLPGLVRCTLAFPEGHPTVSPGAGFSASVRNIGIRAARALCTVSLSRQNFQ